MAFALGKHSSEITEPCGDRRWWGSNGHPRIIRTVPNAWGFLVYARVIGSNEVGDKIVAALECDLVCGGFQQIGKVLYCIVDAFIHYFTTYKQPPSEANVKATIHQVSDRQEAEHTIVLSLTDYRHHFLAGSPKTRVAALTLLGAAISRADALAQFLDGFPLSGARSSLLLCLRTRLARPSLAYRCATVRALSKNKILHRVSPLASGSLRI